MNIEKTIKRGKYIKSICDKLVDLSTKLEHGVDYYSLPLGENFSLYMDTNRSGRCSVARSDGSVLYRILLESQSLNGTEPTPAGIDRGDMLYVSSRDYPNITPEVRYEMQTFPALADLDSIEEFLFQVSTSHDVITDVINETTFAIWVYEHLMSPHINPKYYYSVDKFNDRNMDLSEVYELKCALQAVDIKQLRPKR